MLKGWKEYPKANFVVVGLVTLNEPHDDFPIVANWKYVLAMCKIRNDDDDFVQKGAYYVIHWPNADSNNKCEAPNPPFETGENPDRIKTKKKK